MFYKTKRSSRIQELLTDLILIFMFKIETHNLSNKSILIISNKLLDRFRQKSGIRITSANPKKISPIQKCLAFHSNKKQRLTAIEWDQLVDFQMFKFTSPAYF
jgi:hypothetical protein